MDTGSSVLWVPNTVCPGCTIDNRFNPAESTTYTDLNIQYTEDYALGECSGVFATDVVNIINTPMKPTMKFLLVN